MTAALDVGPFKTRTRQRGGEKNVEFAYYLELEIFDDGSHLRMMLFKSFRFLYFKVTLVTFTFFKRDLSRSRF